MTDIHQWLSVYTFVHGSNMDTEVCGSTDQLCSGCSTYVHTVCMAVPSPYTCVLASALLDVPWLTNKHMKHAHKGINLRLVKPLCCAIQCEPEERAPRAQESLNTVLSCC